MVEVTIFSQKVKFLKGSKTLPQQGNAAMLFNR